MGNGKHEIQINSFTRFLFSLVTLFIMLGALPVGVYLVGQRTSFLPEASVKKPEPTGETSFTIEQDPNLSSNDTVAVNVLARTDKNEANLFAARINYPSNLMMVSSIATSSATLPPGVSPDKSIQSEFIASKWLQASDSDGEITLIGGAPGAGIKTDPNTKYILATIFFKVKPTQSATFHLDPASTIFKSENNTTLQTRENDATFDINVSGEETSSPSATPKSTSRQVIKASPLFPTISLISPIGGELISFNQLYTIKWISSQLDKVSISILLNDQVLGNLASVSASLGQLTFKPSEYILQNFLSPTNTFKIKISGTSAQGITVTDQSRGPFALSNSDGFSLEATQAADLANRGGDANNDGTVDLFDVSKLLSSYGVAKDANFGVDLNGDGVVNDVDFYLLHNLMLQKGLIH